MTERERSHEFQFRAAVLALIFTLFLAGCTKHVPPPPPPPPPAATPTAPPPPARASITSFTAEPSSIERGQASTLSWSIANATDMTISGGVGAVQSQGQRQVFPTSTTTFTLTANGPGGSDT